MIGKIILVIFLLALLGFSFWFIYQNLPGEPEQLIAETGKDKTETSSIIKHSETPMFYNNMRFNHNEISYFIEPSCSLVRQQKMMNAFSILQDKVQIISFYSDEKDKADILVGCSVDYLEQEKKKIEM